MFVKSSSIPTAGNGVFSRRKIASDELPLVACLYPGIFTPPVPIYALRNAKYLANSIPPSYYSSGVEMNDNAYIMNLQGHGGYIDGCALESQYCKPALDSNPSACGHLVNHNSRKVNAQVLDFCWDEVFTDEVDLDNDGNNSLYHLPNELRADGSPWYYDSMHEEVISFRNKPLSNRGVFGAALILIKPLENEDELLLDYKLNEPLPNWAAGWYNQHEC